jgi:ABC-type glycerol-3-phosphate transport system substrate-binding protein
MPFQNMNGNIERFLMIRVHTPNQVWVRFIFLFGLLIDTIACTTSDIPTRRDQSDENTDILASTEPSSILQGEEPNRPVVITFAVDERKKDIYTPLVEEFNKTNTQIVVQMVDIPIGLDFKALASAADTTLVTSGPRLRRTSYFANLSPLAEAATDFAPESFWSEALQSCQGADRQLVGVPLNLLLYGIIFDKGAFQAAGIPYPTPGWNWDDFRATVDALAGQGSPKRPAFEDFIWADDWNSLLSPTIDSILQASGEEVEPSAQVNATKWFLDDVQDGRVSILTDVTMISITQPMMMPATLLAMQDTIDYPNHGFAPFPVGDGSDGTTPVIANCGVVSAGTKHPQAAWQWLNFLSQRWTGRDAAYIPARTSVAEKSGYWQAVPAEWLLAMRFGLEHAWYGPSDDEVFMPVLEGYRQALSGATDLQTALENIRPGVMLKADTTPVVVATPVTGGTLSPEQVVITIPDWGIGDSPGNNKKLADDFHNLHPDILVKFRATLTSSPDELFDNFDCFPSSASNVQEWDTDKLLPLNVFIDENPDLAQDFLPGQLESVTKDGRIYAFPVDFNIGVVSYNADLLAQLGIEPPAADWDYNDFIKITTAVSLAAGPKRLYGMLNGYDILLAENAISLADYNADPPAVHLDSSEMICAVTALVEMDKSGVMPVSSVEKDFLAELHSGQVAFWIGDGWINGWMSHLANYAPPTFKIGHVPYPRTATPVNTLSSGSAYFITKSSSQPRACWELMNFVATRPSEINGFPARRSVAESQDWKAYLGPEKYSLYQAAGAFENPVRLLPPDIWVLDMLWLTALRNSLGGQSPQSALAAAQAKAETYLSCMSTVDQARLSDPEWIEAIKECARQADPDWK